MAALVALALLAIVLAGYHYAPALAALPQAARPAAQLRRKHRDCKSDAGVLAERLRRSDG